MSAALARSPCPRNSPASTNPGRSGACVREMPTAFPAFCPGWVLRKKKKELDTGSKALLNPCDAQRANNPQSRPCSSGRQRERTEAAHHHVPAAAARRAVCRPRGQLAVGSLWPHLSRQPSPRLLSEAAAGQAMRKTPRASLLSQASALRSLLGLGSVGLVVRGLGSAVEQQLRGRKVLFLL